VNPDKIRIIDMKLGKFICFFLTVFYKFTRIFVIFGKKQELITKKVVFIKLIEQGATVIAYSAIKNACARLGKKNVYFLVFDNNKEIIKLINILPEENIIVIRQKNMFTFATDSLKAMRFIKKNKIDTTIDMEFFTRAPVIFAFFSGAKKRIGLHRYNAEGPYRGDILTHKVQYNPYLHVSISYAELTECMFIKEKDLPLLKINPEKIKIENFKYIPSKAEKDRAYEILGTDKNNKKRVILLNPNASDLLPIRKWEIDNFIKLARRFLKEYKDILLYITGAPSEKEKADEISAIINSPFCRSIAGKTTLKELIQVYTVSDLIITNDSGPGLFASITDIKSIVLFGPETPALFGAKIPNSHVIYKGLTCSPCVNVYNHRFSPCRNNICMQDITVDEVFDKAKEVLKDKGKKM